MTVTEQLDLFAPLAAGLCNYGTPKPGDTRPCSEPATHGARWWDRRHRYDEQGQDTGDVDESAGGIDCCLHHANYYATAWCPTFPGQDCAAWIDILPAR